MRIFAHDEAHRGDSGHFGLAELRQRRLVRTLLFLTAAGLLVFAAYRVYTGDPAIVVTHLVVGMACLLCTRWVRVTRRLTRWVVVFLITAFSYLVVCSIAPGLSTPASFAWAYVMPVASYLLLGRLLGFVIAAPFMAAIALHGYLQLWPLRGEDSLILLQTSLIGLLVLFFMHLYESARAKDQARLEQLAHTDTLTGLANRGSFLSSLQQTINESDRTQAAFSLAIMDIDHFKHVNDNFGHNAGDEVLQRIAGQLLQRLRKSDSVGRLGGEEFGLILRGANAATAYEVIEELRDRLATTEIRYHDQQVAVTATFGIAHWPDDSREAAALYQLADQRLYEGKRAGRNVTVSLAHENKRPAQQAAPVHQPGDQGAADGP